MATAPVLFPSSSSLLIYSKKAAKLIALLVNVLPKLRHALFVAVTVRPFRTAAAAARVQNRVRKVDSSVFVFWHTTLHYEEEIKLKVREGINW